MDDRYMYIVYLVTLLAALIVMNWRFVGFDRLFRRREDGPRCDWRMDPARSGRARQSWICVRCGEEAETRDNQRPGPRRCPRDD